MKTLSLFDYRLWLTILLSTCVGVMWNALSPLFYIKPVLLLAMPCTAVFLLLMVTKPRWVIVMILMGRPLLDNVLNSTRVNSSQGDGMGLGAILNLSVIFLGVFLSFYLNGIPPKNTVVLSWIVYLVYMLLTVFYSPVLTESARMWFNYLSYFALFLIPFMLIKNSQDFVYWLKVLGFSFVLPILLATIDMVRGGEYFQDAGMRIEGSFTHPNILAFYLVLAFTFYFYLLRSGYLRNSPFTTMGIKILMVDIIVLLVATKTRNAWIAIYVGFFIYAVLKEPKLLWGLIVVVPLLMTIPQIHQRIADVLKSDNRSDYQGMNSFEWRRQMWTSSIPKIVQRPLQGYGLGSFKYLSNEFSSNKQMGAHNTYLELAFEAGLIGLCTFIALFFSQLFVFFKNMRSALVLGEARVWALMISYIVSYMLICFADNLLYYLVFNWYVWFFLGLMLTAAYRRYPVYVQS